MGWVRSWFEKNPEGVELAQYQATTYNPPQPWWTLSIWLDFAVWHVGVECSREYGGRTWGDRLHLTLYVGPLAFYAARIWNEPVRGKIRS